VIESMTIQIRLADALGEARGPHRYGLCGLDIECNVSLPALQPFEADLSERRATSRVEPLLRSDQAVKYATTGFTGGRKRRVLLETRPEGATIEIQDFGRFSLSADGSIIALDHLVAPTARGLVEECTLGAPLIVSLALRDCWFLHAAAVVVGEHTVVFAGPSGSGKSTLAARLDCDVAYRRISDDLLGLCAGDGGLQAVSSFPQLKLPGGCQSRLPPSPVRTIFVLQPASDGEELAVRKLEKSEKLIALTRHGVAARLFPPRVLARHLAFCREAASVDMTEVVYPRTERALEQFIDLLAISSA
jgi:hypothetical protein